MARRKKKKGRGERYTDAEKKRIMRTALKQNLTGAQVQKRFGVSPLTYYRWRGPVRGGRTSSSNGVKLNEAAVRREVRSRLERMLPQIIRQEVDAFLASKLGARRPGRPRKRGG